MRKTAKVEVYCDQLHEWRWRVRAANSRIMGDSGEGYTRLCDAWRAWRRFRSLLFVAAEITKN